MKRQAKDLGEMVAKPIANKGLVSATHKELFQLKTNSLVKNEKKIWQRHFIKDDKWMADKCIKDVKEMQIKTTVR